MATAIETSIPTYPDSPLESEEAAYPCKGCGEILEEGKAFELAGNRWHIDCFRCNTCDTLLDSDANLLLLGDGSLICNNCTYSCSSCGNKIEDLAILTGDQAFCANCFKCRNCKRKIENLRYARTSQGIFCMDCHEALMARRRKKTGRSTTSQRSKLSNMEKSLPALPPPNARATVYSPDSNDTAYSQNYATQIEGPSMSKNISELRNPESRPSTSEQPTQARGKKDPTGTRVLFESKEIVVDKPADALTLPSTTFSDKRQSYMSQRSDMSGGGEEFFPLAFDPTPPIVQSPTMSKPLTPKIVEEKPRDYFTKSLNSPGSSSKNASPHIAYQEKGRQASRDAVAREAMGSRSGSAAASPYVAMDRGREKSDVTTSLSQVARTGVSSDDKFKLQDAPKMKRPVNSSKGSRNDVPRNDEDRIVMSHQAGPDVGLDDVPEDAFSTPRLSQESSPTSTNESPRAPPQHPSILANLPRRGDSLESTKRQQQTIPRKELNPAANIPTSLTDVLSSSTANAKPSDLAKANGGKIISAPTESPTSKSLYNTPDVTQSDGKKGSESFVDPRAPPMPPPGSSRSRNESISTVPEGQKSPTLPRYSAQGDFTMDEDMARILGNDEAGSSFLKRVSNSVRHGRSYSDKAGRHSRDRWPRSPAGAGTIGPEISSPSTASPESKEEVTWFRNELRRERQKLIDREKRIAQLEGQLQGTASINQVNSELKEKRSTMVVLDTQKEIVVRELEVLTDHIATAKANKEPLDVNKMTNAVLRNFAQELETLKNSFSPQIEDSIQKRNELVDEIANLTQLKEKSFMEFEQLSSKNAQLADLNNQLVGQIQGLYKANSGADTKGVNGLGIYNHKSEKSNFSVDSGDLVKYGSNDATTMDSATTIAAGEAEPVTVLQGPHVVNIRKGQPKKFDWRKGQKVAKGVTKGLKGAFSSAQQSYSRDLEFAETGAYGTASRTPAAQDYTSMSRGAGETGGKGGFGFLNNQKGPPNRNGLYSNAAQGNASTPSLLVDAAAQLYGSDLEQRAEFEKTDIPGIVIRCIGEVEHRGMDVEGIYRKSGANSQVQQVRDAFERDGRDADISDDDLDIHAVTSGLKQYFRKLPTPLITYDVYDRLLEAAAIPDQNAKLEAMRHAVELLPEVHYHTLEYLMKHLARVVLREKENLMTSTNVAVVFAPTIMRPIDVMRELGDTKMKNEAVKEIVESVEVVFAR